MVAQHGGRSPACPPLLQLREDALMDSQQRIRKPQQLAGKTRKAISSTPPTPIATGGEGGGRWGQARPDWALPWGWARQGLQAQGCLLSTLHRDGILEGFHSNASPWQPGASSCPLPVPAGGTGPASPGKLGTGSPHLGPALSKPAAANR